MSTEYIARISHGKDSLKMLDVIVSRGLPLDRITSSDVWATDTIRGEHPKMVEFKAYADEYIWRKYRIEVEHLCAMKNGEKVTYQDLFYHIPKRRTAGGRCPRLPNTMGPLVSIGSQTTRTAGCRGSQCKSAVGARSSKSAIYGFPISIRRGQWCQQLKTRVFSESPTTRGVTKIVEYLGIAADEPNRFGQLSESKRAPLVEFGVEEGLCGLYCQYENILAPSYEIGCRDGCWFCHNQGVGQLRHLRHDYPDLWELLLKWDTDSPVTFHADGHTVHDFDRRFELEDAGFISADDRVFRWSMLDAELNYRLF